MQTVLRIASDSRAPWVNVDQFDLTSGDAGGEPGGQAAHAASADHADAIARQHPGIPQSIQRSLHVRGQYGAGRWHVGRQCMYGRRRHHESILMGMQTEHVAPPVVGRPVKRPGPPCNSHTSQV